MARGYRTAKEKKIKAILSVIALVIAAGVYLYNWYITNNISAEGNFSYHFIDVGQGDCTLILSEENAILVDSGTGESAYGTVEYIRQYTDTIDYMILTHPHEDHIGGADDILEAFTVNNVIMPDASAETVVFTKLLDALEKEGCPVIKSVPGSVYQCGEMLIEIFAPISDSYYETNNYSVVSKITAGGISALITGDAEEYAESEILSRFEPYKLDSYILKSGHHGSSTSTSEEFFAAVSPEIAVISCGEGNSYGHPHREHIALLEDSGTEYYRTDEDGTVVVLVENGEISVFCTSDGDYLQSLQ